MIPPAHRRGHIAQSCAFDVLIGDGKHLRSSGVCAQASLTIQGHTFTTDLFLLPTKGEDVVLGVQWLQELGDVLWNFPDLIMDFEVQGERVRIQGS